MTSVSSLTPKSRTRTGAGTNLLGTAEDFMVHSLPVDHISHMQRQRVEMGGDRNTETPESSVMDVIWLGTSWLSAGT